MPAARFNKALRAHTELLDPDDLGATWGGSRPRQAPKAGASVAARHQSLRSASLSAVETRTGSTRLDSGDDLVVVIAVDAVRRGLRSAKSVAAGRWRVFANREAALMAAKHIKGDVARGKSGIVKHGVLSSS